MGNEILAIILWLVSIPLVAATIYGIIFVTFLKNVDRALNRGADSLGAYFRLFWPVLAGWALVAIWAIVAVVNALAHVVAAFQIASGVVPA